MADLVQVDCSTSTAVDGSSGCTLQIPNELLWQWNKNEYHRSIDEDLIDELNQHIKGGILSIKVSSNRVATNLRNAIAKIGYRRAKCGGSRSRNMLMSKKYGLQINTDETESFVELKERMLNAEEIAREKEKEIDELLEAMAADYSTFLDEIEEQRLMIKEIQGIENFKGRKIDDVGPRQARRHIAKVTTRTKTALLFAQTFGLMPEKVIMRRQSGEKVSQ